MILEPLTIDESIVKPVFIVVGRLSHEKGQLRLINICKQLFDEGYIFSLWIVGDGPDKVEIDNYVLTNNLSRYIKTWGYQENPYSYIRLCDLYICPSYTEALSTTCIEALYTDLPVLTTEVAGAGDIVGDSRCGIVVKNNDISIYIAIKEIITHPEVLKEYQGNISAARNKFCDKKILNQLEDIFASTVGEF